MRSAVAALSLTLIAAPAAAAVQSTPEDQSDTRAGEKAMAKASEASDDADALTGFDIDTPIRLLVANPEAKAVLDADMPGLSSDENFAKFKEMSLRELQPKTGGKLTDELLEKVDADLKAIDGGYDAGDDTQEDQPAGR